MQWRIQPITNLDSCSHTSNIYSSTPFDSHLASPYVSPLPPLPPIPPPPPNHLRLPKSIKPKKITSLIPPTFCPPPPFPPGKSGDNDECMHKSSPTSQHNDIHIICAFLSLTQTFRSGRSFNWTYLPQRGNGLEMMVGVGGFCTQSMHLGSAVGKEVG